MTLPFSLPEKLSFHNFPTYIVATSLSNVRHETTKQLS